MTELTVVAMRLGFFILLWLFVFIVAGVLRRDLFAPRAKKAAKREKKANKAAKRSGADRQAASPANAAGANGANPAAANAGVAPAAQSRGYAPAHQQAQQAQQTPRELVITSGHLVGVSVALGDAPVTLGRASDNTVVLDDDFASGHHARVYPSGVNWVLEDLNSTNGTFLAQQRVTGAVQLPVNVPVTVGHTTLELRT